MKTEPHFLCYLSFILAVILRYPSSHYGQVNLKLKESEMGWTRPKFKHHCSSSKKKIMPIYKSSFDTSNAAYTAHQ